MANKSPMQALAQYIDFDLAEMKEYRYHAGHTSIPVYTVGDYYYCCVKGNGKPAKYLHRGNDQSIQWNWVKATDVGATFAAQDGYTIYKCKAETE